MKKPVVSIIIPAYHAERFISRALVSIMDQTLQDFEILVVIGSVALAVDQPCKRLVLHGGW